MKQTLTSLLFILFLNNYCLATQLIYIDSTRCAVKNFDTKNIAAYKGDKNFVYEDEPESDSGFFSRLALIWMLLMGGLLKGHLGSISFLDFLFYGLAIFAAIMIASQVFNVKIQGLFSRSQVALINHSTETENIHETNFENLITDAVTKKNFRLATRLFYLKTLKALSTAGLINWQKNKTNFEYYYELKGEPLRQRFYQLTLTFESAWYGNHEITEDIFNKNSEAFSGFLHSLGR